MEIDLTAISSCASKKLSNFHFLIALLKLTLALILILTLFIHHIDTAMLI